MEIEICITVEKHLIWRKTRIIGVFLLQGHGSCLLGNGLFVKRRKIFFCVKINLLGRGEFRGKENGTKERNSPLRERREK